MLKPSARSAHAYRILAIIGGHLIAASCLLVAVILFVDREVERVEAAAERRVLAEVTDNAELRARTNSAWQGFDAETAERISRIAQDFYLLPEVLAAVAQHENGRIQIQAGAHKVPAWIRIKYRDAHDWPYAAAALILQKKALRMAQRHEFLFPFLTEAGKQYNPENAEAWAKDISQLVIQYWGCRGIPVKQPAKAAAKPRRNKL